VFEREEKESVNPIKAGVRWRRVFKASIRVSAERRAVVLDEISHGSIPSLTYYVLLGVSGLLAGFGLLSNSAAVVVGAMLVSPLMTPIFGITVSLVNGDTVLLRRAMTAEFGGVALVLALTFVLGMMPFSLEITPEMLARTKPNLLDLLVATLAGFAGCMAMLDERISPVLPGVAIATSLTPPLATSGLSLAFGSYEGAWGAFLLFFANFLAILIVAAVSFSLSGLIISKASQSTGVVFRRFLTPTVGLIVVSVLLTHYLTGMIDRWRVLQTANRVIEQQLSSEPSTAVEQVMFDRQNGNDGINVLAVLRTPRVIDPEKAKTVESALSKALNSPVQMFFRCSITHDVTAAGSANLLARPDLNGAFTEKDLPEEVRIVQIAEQVVREKASELPNIDLKEVRLVKFSSGPVLVVSIVSPREPLPEAVASVEHLINDRIGGGDVRLLVRVVSSVDVTRKGRLLLGEAHFGEISEEQARMQNHIEEFARQLLTQIEGVIVLSLDAAKFDNEWRIRVEAIGPHMLSPADIQRLESRLVHELNEPIKVAILSRTEAVVTNTGYYSAVELAGKTKQNSTAEVGAP